MKNHAKADADEVGLRIKRRLSDVETRASQARNVLERILSICVEPARIRVVRHAYQICSQIEQLARFGQNGDAEKVLGVTDLTALDEFTELLERMLVDDIDAFLASEVS